MMRTITPAAMQALEQSIMAATGMPSLLLMEHAALAVVDCAAALAPLPAHALFLCGSGNNGGDGCAAARLWVQRGGTATVWLLAAPAALRGDAALQAALLPHAGVAVRVLGDAPPPFPADAAVAVDALFGTGLSRAPEGCAAALIAALNASRLPVVAVDIPSGIDGADGQCPGPAVRAAATVAFHRPKPGHFLFPGRAHTGALTVAGIGLPPALDDVPGLRVLAPDDVGALLPPRPRDAHKGTFGHTLVVAGSRGMAGAAALCAQAALRSGAGLVTVACPASILPTVQQLVPCAMALPLPERDGHLAAEAAARLAGALPGKDAVALGPGLGTAPETADALAPLWACALPRVVDADALNLLARAWQADAHAAPALRGAVLTPHPGEMSRLTDAPIADIAAAPVEAAQALARRTGATVLLKGATTVVAGAAHTTLNLTGCPGMATGGSGDVLTGLIAGLCAQGMPGEDAACAGAYLHGRAGELAAARCGQRGMTAADIACALTSAFPPARENA